ncbi:MAG: ATP synthase F1 subunit delta [Bdellovibrionales bacterium]|nr:ATP synthase F1 subunit delta [Bdellovibrionales bacterium]
MANPTVLARKYAKALYDLAKTEGVQEKILLQLSELKKAVAATSLDSKEQVESLIGQLAFHPLVSNTLKLMADNKRLSLVSTLHDQYQSLLDEDMGVVRGVVSSANVLNNEQRKEIEARVNAITNKRAILSFKEEPEMLGGFVVHAGAYKIDGSLKNQLTKMKISLNNGVH